MDASIGLLCVTVIPNLSDTDTDSFSALAFAVCLSNDSDTDTTSILGLPVQGNSLTFSDEDKPAAQNLGF